MLAKGDNGDRNVFHRRAFLVWLAVIISVAASAMVNAHLNPPDEFKGAGMDQLIEAALAHAQDLRNGANAADDYGASVTEEEAQRWEHLAAAAKADLASRGDHFP